MKPLFIIFALFSITIQRVSCEISSDCRNNNSSKSLSFLDVATDMIAKAKLFYPTCPTPPESKPIDCADVLQAGHKSSGVYTVWPINRVLDGSPMSVFCDMETEDGGWTVIQRRGNFSRLKDYFYKDWDSYKKGFGDILKDFWLGNDNIFALSNQRLYSIRFDMRAVDGDQAYALYDSFWIDDEKNKYRIYLQDYSGTAGDSMTSHHNHMFSTKDQENDVQEIQNCAQLYKGGWWYHGCHDANLNGQYLGGKHESFADGINWLSWKGYKESLAATEMKIRPKNFKTVVSQETPKKKTSLRKSR